MPGGAGSQGGGGGRGGVASREPPEREHVHLLRHRAQDLLASSALATDMNSARPRADVALNP
eukprot:7525886-Pyramimonas_sp.AAC.1